MAAINEFVHRICQDNLISLFRYQNFAIQYVLETEQDRGLLEKGLIFFFKDVN